MSYTYTADEIDEKYLEARRLKLSGWWLFRDVDRAIISCNGIGAAWFPAWLRWVVSTLFPSLIIVADIHDIRYEIGGDAETRRKADAEFLANGYVVAEAKYGHFFPVRWAAELTVRLMYRALRIGGRVAWDG